MGWRRFELLTPRFPVAKSNGLCRFAPNFSRVLSLDEFSLSLSYQPNLFAKRFNKSFSFVRQKSLIFERIKKLKDDIHFVTYSEPPTMSFVALETKGLFINLFQKLLEAFACLYIMQEFI